MKPQDKGVDLRRPRGRKRLFDQPMEAVSTRIPQTHYDRLCRLASQQGKDVAEVVREVLIIRLS